MRKMHLLAAVLAVTAAPAVLAAQGDAKAAPKAAAPAKPGVTPEQQAAVQRAAVILRSFNLAFQSKEVTQPVKGALLICLYNNKLADITAATNRALAASPNGAQPDATSVYRAAAGVCGVKFEAKAAGAAPGAAAPKPGAPSKTGDSR